MLQNLLHDVRYALHGFASRPMFAVVVVLTLAVGIGVNVAVFSLFDRLMLRELNVANPNELVKVVSPGPRAGNQLGNQQGTDDETFSYPLFRDLQAAGEPDVDLAASWIAQVSLGNGDRTVRGSAVLVSGGYFAALGVGPQLGRVLGEQDVVDAEPAATVVLSFDYWTTAFGADPAVLGKTLVVAGQPLEIVGVMPRGFVGTTPGSNSNVFAPLTLDWYRDAQLPKPIVADRFFTYLYVFGRLRPGASLDAAQARLDVAFRAIINDVEAPEVAARSAAAGREFEEEAEYRARTLSLVPGARGQSRAQQNRQTPLAVFFAATATILLIACVNLANLMFARGAARVGEIAVRASLGAARHRLYALLAIEALLLAGFGALLSLPVALGVLHTVDALQPPGLRVISVGLDTRMAAVALGIGVLSVVAFALAPMTKLVGADPARALQAGGVRTFGGKGLGRFRFALASTQIALSMLLLVLAALFTQSLVNAARVDLGLRTESIVTFRLAPSLNGYSLVQGAQVLEAVERTLASQPGVTHVSTSSVLLLGDSQWRTNATIEGSEQTQNVLANAVGTDFFAALEIPLLQGRIFTGADRLDAPNVAIVNERFVERFGLGANPVGKRFSFDRSRPPDVEIVGVVRDAAYAYVKEPFVAQVITPRAQSQNFGVGAAFYVRTTQPTDAVLAAIPGVVASVDSSLPVIDARTFASQVRRNLQTDWLLLTLAGVLAAIATLLAAIGLYGVLSYMVAQRSREIGLRLALGAQAAGVRRMVMKQVVWMVMVGVPVGLTAALLVGRLASSQLFGLAPTDPLAVTGAALVLAATVLGASYWPARRASRVDPVVALRAE
jgi:putative ABC transport system permease protein